MAPTEVLDHLDAGDVLIVTRLDRLARSTRDLLNVLAAVGERGAGFKSLKDAWADTTTAHGRLMLTVLGGLAEFERELIMARTGEGRLRAKARGVRFGRPRSLTPHQRQEAMQRLADGEVQADLARSYGVSQATISRLSGDGAHVVGVTSSSGRSPRRRYLMRRWAEIGRAAQRNRPEHRQHQHRIMRYSGSASLVLCQTRASTYFRLLQWRRAATEACACSM